MEYGSVDVQFPGRVIPELSASGAGLQATLADVAVKGRHAHADLNVSPAKVLTNGPNPRERINWAGCCRGAD
jgi:hypothetical protein